METRRRMLAYMGAAALAPLAQTARAAAGYPERPVRLVVPYPPGGGSDSYARIISPIMSQLLGQQFVVDNRPGAATIIGAEQVAKAPADGYTLLLGDNSTYAVNASLYAKLPYNALTDFAPISLTARFALLLVVNPAVPAKTVAEFVAYAKSRPDAATYGSPGTGSPHHLAMALFAQRAGIALTHVPYKGGAPAAQDLIGGQIPAMMLDLATAAQYIRTGRLRALATAGGQRLEQFPDLPTVAESGYPGFEAWAWQGIVAPAHTPQPIVDQLNACLVKLGADQDVRKRMYDLGGEVTSSTPAAMHAYMQAETDKWARIIKDTHITIE